MADAQLQQLQQELDKGLTNKTKKEQKYKTQRDKARKDLQILKTTLLHLEGESKTAAEASAALQAEKDGLVAEKEKLVAEKSRLEEKVNAEKAKIEALETRRMHEEQQCEKEKAKYVQFVKNHRAALGAGSDSDDEGAEAAGAAGAGANKYNRYNLNF